MDTFDAMPLVEPLHQALKDKNYTTPSPIQQEAIPQLLTGADLLGSAQTGTGKTAAFALPILQLMHEKPRERQRKQMRALILTPTRELSIQVAKSFAEYGKYLNFRTALAYGGVAIKPQIEALREGLDILVATPGRLLDLQGQKQLDLRGVEFFVLDEADRMLDMGFIQDIRKIVGQLPKKRQSLFFSATLSPQITRLAGSILTDPVEVRIAPQETTAENVDHSVYFIDPARKLATLIDLLDDQLDKDDSHLSLIFCRTKSGADHLVSQLNQHDIPASAIHGDKNQNARQRTLDKFRKGRIPVLVATDVAARGIDIRDVTLVVNYDLPNEPEAYVHRIGRTARGGLKGRAVTFGIGGEFKELRAIEGLIKKPIPVETDHPYHDDGLMRRYQSFGSTSKGSSFASSPGRRNKRNRGTSFGKR